MIGVAIGVGALLLIVLFWIAARVMALHRVVPERVIPRPGAFAALARQETWLCLEQAAEAQAEVTTMGPQAAQEPVAAFDVAAIAGGLGLLTAPTSGWIAPLNKHLLAVFKQGVHAQLQSLSNLSLAIDVTHVETITTHLGTKLIADAYCLGATMQRATGTHAAHSGTHLSLFCGHAHVVSCMGSPRPITDAFAGIHSLSVASPFSGTMLKTANAHLGAIHPMSRLAASAGAVHEHATIGVHLVAHAHGGLAGSSVAGQVAAPVGALLISSFHEGRLLLRHDTDLTCATKNVSLDVGGVFVGGKSGMLAGGAAGSVIGPHGTAIGGLIGGVAGVVGGKLAAGKIKRHPYEVAKRSFIEARDRFEAEETKAVAAATTEWEAKRAESERGLRRDVALLEQDVACLEQRLQETLRATTSLDARTAQAHLVEAEAGLAALIEGAEARLRRRARGLGKLAPALVAPEEYRQLQQLRIDATDWRHRAATAMSNAAGDEAASERLLDLVLAIPGCEGTVRDRVRDINEARMTVLSTLDTAYANLVGEGFRMRRQAAKTMARESRAIKRRLHKHLTPFYAAIEQAEVPLRNELRKLGHSVAETA